MQGFLSSLQRFGIGRLVALGGVAAGVAAVLAAVMLRAGGEPQSVLWANLDPKEAAAVATALDGAGVKYELKGDGTTLTVARDKVASARLLVAGKGIVTSGSVGYEIFDGAPALGQTDFVQQLNRQRALEGELARTIGTIHGVSNARVMLNMPKKQLFEEDSDAQASASVMLSTTRRLGAEQVRTIRNMVAPAVPGLKPDRVAVADQSGDLLAAAGEAGVAAPSAARNEVEEKTRKMVLSLVEGVVGPGRARVQVTADLDMNRVTTSEEKFDPDGQVVRSTSTGEDKTKEQKAGLNGAVSASQNIPGAAGGGANGNDSSDASKTDETTNYEISKTVRTEVQEPGKIQKLAVSVAVDGVTAPAVKGKPGAYTPRSADEMAKIDRLVRAAVGFDDKRGDRVEVLNVRFDQPAADAGAGGSAMGFDKNDVLRGAELLVMLAVAAMLVLFVLRPMLRGGGAGGGTGLSAFAGAGGGGVASLQPVGASGAAGALAAAGGQALLPGPEMEARIDIARIEGQVRASSVKQVADFVDQHPDASVSILRGWLHETG